MMSALWQLPSEWGTYDTWIVITAALAAAACALPGNYLLLRRQSLLGDALSHSVLPGIVLSYLAWNSVEHAAGPAVSEIAGLRHLVLFVGAAGSGLLAALLSEWTHRLGRVDSGSALGVVFTTFFAFGLLLIRLAADQAHIDPGCVLYGNLETIVIDTLPGTSIPRASIVNGVMVLLNAGLWALFYKELQLTAFDPGFAETLGLPTPRLQYAAAAVTAMTLVAAFETVGSILVIAMLIVPAATARLLTDRLKTMLIVSAILAVLSAVLGHVGALIVPSLISSMLGSTEDVGAGTAGMMALAAGLLFLAALIVGPKYGLLRRAWDRAWWEVRIAAEDILGILYRLDELGRDRRSIPVKELAPLMQFPPPIVWLAARRLTTAKLLEHEPGGYRLTQSGRDRAREIIRSHRLWEAFLAQRFRVPEERVHASAEKVEHFLGESLREGLAAELGQATQDPHGRTIPPEHPGTLLGSDPASGS